MALSISVTAPAFNAAFGRVSNAEPNRRLGPADDSAIPAESTRSTAPPQTADASAARRSADELALIRRLAARDQQVRAHELAHVSVGGSYVGQASYTYQRGPDGVLYAVGGEVPVDASPVPGDPAATIAKENQVARAALAPADPSSADRRIAARANQLAAAARQELVSQTVAKQTRVATKTTADEAAPSKTEESGSTAEASPATNGRATSLRLATGAATFEPGLSIDTTA